MRNNVVFHDYESVFHIGMPLVLFSLVLSYLRRLFGNRPALWSFPGPDPASRDQHRWNPEDSNLICAGILTKGPRRAGLVADPAGGTARERGRRTVSLSHEDGHRAGAAVAGRQRLRRRVGVSVLRACGRRRGTEPAGGGSAGRVAVRICRPVPAARVPEYTTFQCRVRKWGTRADEVSSSGSSLSPPPASPGPPRGPRLPRRHRLRAAASCYHTRRSANTAHCLPRGRSFEAVGTIVQRGCSLKVLVSGVTGFTGGHLARSLLRRGIDVRGLVRPTSQAQAAGARRRGRRRGAGRLDARRLAGAVPARESTSSITSPLRTERQDRRTGTTAR